MEYNSILKRIEEQKKEENLSTKLFRYTGLIQAIEFFSQKLNLDQIIEASFDFVNELLTLEKSAIFTLNHNNYILKKVKGYVDTEITLVKNTQEIQNIAVFHGTLLYERESMEKYFESAVLDAFTVTAIIPLIIENSLFGFIFISSKAAGEINSDDYIISEALMKLFNNALENYKRFEDLQKANRELDEKIFNLFAINQSSKALLSELSLDVLYNLSIDVFSELTQSSSTGFVLFDDKVDKYVLKAFKDIHYSEPDSLFGLTSNKGARVDTNKLIVDVTNEGDILYFNNLFIEGIEKLNSLNAKYVVMLIKGGKILGFVTLGQSVTGSSYKKSIFELIESLASATFIALSNAQLFKQVNEQKKIIQSKLEKLVSLNKLMRNINSSLKLETLLDLTLKTLEISFDVEKALIALYDKEKDSFNITNTINFSTKKRDIKPNENWKKVFEGDTLFETKGESVQKYFSSTLLNDVGTSQGMLIFPICIDRVDVEMLGVIIVFKYYKLPIGDEESILTLETISGHIAPVVGNLYTIEEQKRFLLPNYIELFKRDLKNDIKEAQELSLDLQVIQISDERKCIFKGSSIVDKLGSNFKRVYPFSNNHIFIVINDNKDYEKEIRKAAGLKEVIVRRLVLNQDFHNYQEFFKLF
ncbi:MAG: GAF domain-containing protein [Clostridia bacterium]|nr:GAF domain-containing protein [Clostridia bacterium]